MSAPVIQTGQQNHRPVAAQLQQSQLDSVIAAAYPGQRLAANGLFHARVLQRLTQPRDPLAKGKRAHAHIFDAQLQVQHAAVFHSPLWEGESCRSHSRTVSAMASDR